ncbi:MAG: FliM/FliN family flagellar motor switch protein [Myxococcales bacterium]|nr:FliM/FliN family flagellar motor switch protein [Myxococcales bacterium]
MTTPRTPDAPPLADKPLGRPYRLECPSGPFRADLWFDGTVARRERRRVLPPETAIPCPVVAARGHLPAGKLQPAAAGDVLLLDDVFLEGAHDTFRATARLCAGDHEWPCEIREGRVHLLDVPTTAPPQGNPTMRTIPEENTSLEEIPVQVTVELAQVPMTLGDLERLGPGDVIDTEVPIDATAVVRAGVVYFGRAEIVDLEGRIGFRLVDRAPPPPAR